MIARDDAPEPTRATRFAPRALDDVRLALEWYDQHAPGVAPAFLLALDAVLAQASRYPESYPVVRPELRRGLLRRFPYGVFYVVEANTLVVLAVVHARRHPATWPRQAGG